MADARATNRPSPVLPRRLLAGLAVTTALVAVNTVVGERGLVALVRARAERDALAAAVGEARRENHRLVEIAASYRSDPTTIETLARRELGLAGADETVVYVRTTDAVSTPR